LLTAEISDESPGQGAVLDRLLDLVLVTALRQVFSTANEHAPTWYSAREDPVASRAIELIHHHPAHPWSVASLADACGVSRATLARRFTRAAAQTPMAFLAGWRLAIAADLLSDPQLTLGAVAARVGYADAFALSAAFKRAYAIAPSEYRRRSMTSGDASPVGPSSAGASAQTLRPPGLR